jgi:phthalate 4,5-dioxygenase oxygenase subunit
MLTHEDNELLTRIGPDTPMGNVVRRFWIPALLSEELPEAGGAPKRVKLLGENLIAFRDPNGKVAIMDEFCPHRGASLLFGRNEDCGFRCIYHGWLIDGSGLVTETPTEPPEANIKNKLRHLAYPTHEQGDLIWTYMGPNDDKMPPFPNYEWTTIAKESRVVSKIHEECNWVQAMEGALDAAHASILHSGQLPPFVKEPSRDLAPRIEVQDTSYGFRFGAIHRPTSSQSSAPDKHKYVRVFNFALPFHVFVPKPDDRGSMHIFVPMDDENTMWFGVSFVRDRSLDPYELGREKRGAVVGVDLDENYRKSRNLRNNYLQDREAMKNNLSFSGIQGIGTQDMACQESLGPIYDRTKEHLGVSDIGIIRMRRIMLRAAKGLLNGIDPPGIDPAVPQHLIRCEEKLVALDTPWQTVGAFAREDISDNKTLAGN